jgi:ribose transport system ATP-binding protein
MTRATEIIRLENITKRFGGVTALNDVCFGIAAGEVHAVVGENGAGKSTLMKLLAGVQEQDSGKVFINGTEVQLDSPRAAEEFGISMVFQELNLFGPLTVAANIYIRREIKTKNGFLDEAAMIRESQVILDTLGVDIDPKAKINSLSVGQKQIVEIARALSRGTHVIIMDEPNSALNDKETQALFDIIRSLKERGLTIIYVSHRLEEVFTISDRISVLRDGKYIGTWGIQEISMEEIVTHVVGRCLDDIFPERPPLSPENEVTLSVKEMVSRDPAEAITFSARRGEVLGFAGLEGSGVQEVFNRLFGLEKITAGEIFFNGARQKNLSPAVLIRKGWAMIPANRRDEGLMLDWSIKKNVSVVIIERLLSQLGLIDWVKEKEVAIDFIGKLNIATESVDKIVGQLSGGNQQKVVLAKWLATNPTVLILNDPTRGIDVGAKHEVYQLINNWAQQGFTILLTSSEIEETLGLSDRILVMYRGKIIREFQAKQTNKAEVMKFVLSGEAAESGSGGNLTAVALHA